MLEDALKIKGKQITLAFREERDGNLEQERWPRQEEVVQDEENLQFKPDHVC